MFVLVFFLCAFHCPFLSHFSVSVLSGSLSIQCVTSLIGKLIHCLLEISAKDFSGALKVGCRLLLLFLVSVLLVHLFVLFFVSSVTGLLPRAFELRFSFLFFLSLVSCSGARNFFLDELPNKLDEDRSCLFVVFRVALFP